MVSFDVGETAIAAYRGDKRERAGAGPVVDNAEPVRSFRGE